MLAHLGPAASDEIALQMSQLIKATNTKFCDAVINGDTAKDANGFDGLDKALKDSSTELNKEEEGTERDWSKFTSADEAMSVLDDLDELLMHLMVRQPCSSATNAPWRRFAQQRAEQTCTRESQWKDCWGLMVIRLCASRSEM
ncbi:hypothetical protein [Corynebacterium diphtheriae]|uniref:hypothetical protein n=1 Tax=Corynebacterium diphtheriae TaxID=1717 RepID=UPI001FDA620A|nr:hypothetical protein [Corynebacterium diphtheriae]